MEERIAILYVDDVEENLDAFDLVLGEEMLLFTSSNEARIFALLAAHPEIGVAVVDWKMPGVNGLEIIRRIKAARPDVACILFTAFLSPELEAACAADPRVFRWATKPLEFAGPVFQGLLADGRTEHKRLKGSRGQPPGRPG